MAAEKPLPLKPSTGGSRHSRSATVSHNPPLSPQELPAGRFDLASPTIAQGLHVVVNDDQDHGLYPVSQYSAASSPQMEKILWMGPCTIVTQAEKSPSIRNPRPPSGYFIPKTRVRRCLIVTAITIISVAIVLGLVIGLTESFNIQRLLSNSHSNPADGSNTQQLTGTTYNSLYNDTSIAAFETEDRQRHVFYQTINGSIQHAIYSSDWSFHDLGVLDARNHTPLTALSGDNGVIYLFYITNSDILTSREIMSGFSKPCPVLTPLEIFDQTRQLTASRIPSYNGDASDFQLLVLTQRPGTGVSMIHLATNSTQSAFEERDVTADLNGSNSNSRLIFNCPVAIAANISGASRSSAPFLSTTNNYTWIGVFSNGNRSKFTGENFIGTGYNGKQLNSDEFGAMLSTPVPSPSYDLGIAIIHDQMSILYVNNSMLVSSGETNSNSGSVKNHNSPYPFTRLGTFLSADGLYYAYHQLNESTMAEAIFDPMTNWTTSNITIPA